MIKITEYDVSYCEIALNQGLSYQTPISQIFILSLSCFLFLELK